MIGFDLPLVNAVFLSAWFVSSLAFSSGFSDNRPSLMLAPSAAGVVYTQTHCFYSVFVTEYTPNDIYRQPLMEKKMFPISPFWAYTFLGGMELIGCQHQKWTSILLTGDCSMRGQWLDTSRKRSEN